MDGIENNLKEKQKITTEQSAKELHPGSISQVRPSKSDEPVTSTIPVSKSNSIKSEKDVKFVVTPSHGHERPDGSPDKKENKSHKTADAHKINIERHDSRSSINSPKVHRKYFTNWRQACDKTKDRTKELLKRWRTLPESEGHHTEDEDSHSIDEKDQSKGHGWSVHVWSKFRVKLRNILLS